MGFPDEYYGPGVIPDDADDFDEFCFGMESDGYCANAGTEWCDWRCPFSHELPHNKRLKAAVKRKRRSPLLDILDEALHGGEK